jgi:SAM-dependent methyltransferase
MNREQTNRVRFVMEEILPPFVRDSALFRHAAKLAWGRHIDHLADFRQRAPMLTAKEYETLYRQHPRVHDDTDNSVACIDKIAANVIGDSVCDVGCGTGHLLRMIRKHKGDAVSRYVGVDFVIPEHFSPDGLEFVEAAIEKLPFPDGAFDTVVCTHVIEHILDYRAAIAELRRVAKRRLIIVVPREREAIYTFNPHFNFFPYKHSFLRAMIPLKASYDCVDVGRDIYYQEDLVAP